MAKFQVPLNGSNIVSKDRQQKFEEALQDQHQVDCGPDQITVEERDPTYTRGSNTGNELSRLTENQESETQSNPTDLSLALDHTYTHQARTMEIHQLYLSQQTDYLDLITEVLNQQGKVLDQQTTNNKAEIMETFQRTLDNFHTLREQGLRVHQDFLAQQAAFSERYLEALEGGYQPAVKTQETQQSSQQTQKSHPAEWVVQVPPIVLDEKAAVNKTDQPSKMVPANPEPISAVPVGQLSDALLKIVSEKTGYPAEMLELNMDLEADLGIDSIKRVEILGVLEEEFPSLPPADTEVLSQTRTLQEIVDYMNEESGQIDQAEKITQNDVISQPPRVDPSKDAVSEPAQNSNPSLKVEHNISDLTEILLGIVAEKTGYPVEMLEPDMDMEADLGIDSIKRVEILGSMEDQVPGLPAVETEALAELRTLGQIVDLMSKDPQDNPANSSAEVVEKKKVEEKSGLQSTPVKLVNLAAPDQLQVSIPGERPIIVSNEGSDFTQVIVNRLTSLGWKVLTWNYPPELIGTDHQSISVESKSLQQEESGKEHIQDLVSKLREEHGSPIGFIHLHPLASSENGLFSTTEEQLIKQVFLIAGELKEDLIQVEPSSRNFFLTVTRTDGSLGLKNDRSFQEGIGLTGLIKTLKLEWPEVYCRSVDLNPDLAHGEAGDYFLSEMLDPDLTISEVGITGSARVTLERDYQYYDK
jgi:acyl carrier protein